MLKQFRVTILACMMFISLSAAAQMQDKPKEQTSTAAAKPEPVLRPTKEQALEIANIALQSQAKHSEARAQEAEAKILDEQLPMLIKEIKRVVCGKEADKYRAQLDDKGQLIFVLKPE
jgi:hypothetical protein